MKKFICLLLISILFLSNVSCSNSNILSGYNLPETEVTFNENNEYKVDDIDNGIVIFSFIGIGINLVVVSTCKLTRLVTGIQSKCAEAPFFIEKDCNKL